MHALLLCKTDSRVLISIIAGRPETSVARNYANSALNADANENEITASMADTIRKSSMQISTIRPLCHAFHTVYKTGLTIRQGQARQMSMAAQVTYRRRIYRGGNQELFRLCSFFSKGMSIKRLAQVRAINRRITIHEVHNYVHDLIKVTIIRVCSLCHTALLIDHCIKMALTVSTLHFQTLESI